MWWIVFNLFVLLLMALDLGVFHRKAHEVRIREAVFWSILWVFVALLFNLGVYLFWPPMRDGLNPSQAGLAFLTGYIIERALSIDNIFVFVVLFRYFRVDPKYQHRLLMWGILGALIMRAVFIVLGIELIQRFHWTIYVLGAFLIVTGIKMVLMKDKEIHPERNPVLRISRRLFPITPDYVEGRFFARINGRLLATPLFIVLLVVETTDVVFALDSIPAILGITTNTFIVYTSNVFAILGLRALYFVMAGMMHLFHYLTHGLATILIFVGAKMVLEAGFHYEISIALSLSVVALILAISIIVSLALPKKEVELPSESTDLV